MRIQISSRDMDRIRRELARSPEVIATEINRYFRNTAIDMQRDAVKEAPVHTGTLQSRIDIVPGNLQYRIIPRAEYAAAAHDGRRPGKQPPVDAIRSWANSKGIDPFVLARSIGQKGTKGTPFLRMAFEKNENKAMREGRRTLDRIVRAI